MSSNKPPYAVVELDEETYKFLVSNCDTNIAFARGSLMALSEDNARKMVTLLEQFKAARKALEAAKL